MESLTPFQRFIDLVKFDQQAQQLASSIETLKKEISLVELQREHVQTSLDTAQKNIVQAEQNVRLQEMRMKELQEKESQKKALLDTVTAEKEYQALKREIESLKRSQHLYEQDLIQSWNSLEHAQKEMNALTTLLQAKIDEFEKERAERQKVLNDAVQKLEAHKQERLAKEKNLPEEWLSKYNIMYLQVPNPIVPLVGQSCSACFYDVTRQEYLDLLKRQLLQCKGCYRLIYLEHA